MKPGWVWIGVSRLNSLMSNEVQALIKVFPHHWGIRNHALIWGSPEALSKGRAHAAASPPSAAFAGGFLPSLPSCLHRTRYLWVQFG